MKVIEMLIENGIRNVADRRRKYTRCGAVISIINKVKIKSIPNHIRRLARHSYAFLKKAYKGDARCVAIQREGCVNTMYTDEKPNTSNMIGAKADETHVLKHINIKALG